MNKTQKSPRMLAGRSGGKSKSLNEATSDEVLEGLKSTVFQEKQKFLGRFLESVLIPNLSPEEFATWMELSGKALDGYNNKRKTLQVV